MQAVWTQCHGTLGDEDRLTLNARLWLGIALRCAGHPDQAAGHIDEARTGLTSGWGEDSSDALACRLSQALNLLALGRIQEGRTTAEDVLQVYDGRVGAEHPHSLIGKLNISTALCLEERYPAAETAARSAFEGLQVRLDPAHPYTLAARMVLASTLAFQNNLAEAEELEEEVTTERERVLGRQHPDTLRNRVNLLLTRHARGIEAASDERQAAVRELAEALGSGHPDVAVARNGGRLLCAIDPQPF
jgi:non-specific serine/threonine protein kinase/serine/threonine-protein kinase